MIKVLFLAENLSYGGAQKMLTFLANSLDKEKFQVSILNQNAEVPIARRLNEDIQYFEHKQYKGKLKRIKEIIYLRDKVVEEDIDVIVSFLTFPNLIATVVKLLCKVKVIISERGDPTILSDFINRCFRLFENIADGAVFQTVGAQQCYPRLLQKKSVVIANPVVTPNLSKPYAYRNEILNIASVGRFECIQKRQDLLIKAFSDVILKGYNVVLNFYGTGPDEEMCKELVKKYGISNKVNFHGKTLNVQEELLKNDLFILTSDFEGIPNVLIEAMSIGMPVIATDCSPGGAALLIENGINGILVPTGDNILLAEAVTSLIEHPERATQLGIEAIKICEKFTPNIIVNMWEDYIISVFNRRRKK